MKKYKLELKNPNCDIEVEGLVCHDGELSEYKWLGKDGYGYDYRRIESSITRFTQEEIDGLPHGLIKLHDIIEIKEDEYNIICPITGNCLAYGKGVKKYMWINGGVGKDSGAYRRQFTKSEIESNLKCYLTDKFMVKIIQNK